jgi:hypothetical protein
MIITRVEVYPAFNLLLSQVFADAAMALNWVSAAKNALWLARARL